MSEIFVQGCTNPGHHIAQATEFCMMAVDICGSSVWNLLHVIILVLRILS